MKGICDILVRIRICGPYLWLMDPDPDPTLDPTSFFSDFKYAKKISILQALQYSISVRSTPLGEKGRIRSWIRIRTSDLWIRNREAQKHADPADPDPQHCRRGKFFNIFSSPSCFKCYEEADNGLVLLSWRSLCTVLCQNTCRPDTSKDISIFYTVQYINFDTPVNKTVTLKRWSNVAFT